MNSINARNFLRFGSIVLPVLLIFMFGASAVSGVRSAGAATPGSESGSRGALGWTVRVIGPQELEKLSDRDMDMSPSYASRLLARLNARDFDYIQDDIRNGRPIRAPNDFESLKNWTPMPGFIPQIAGIPKFILIVKDIPFIGWYENGRLAGDTYICIGKREGLTTAGLYSVKQKDIDHVSRSYPNAYGEPAPMPWALRIYGAVWIHAGDITGGYCSHGCVNLPVPQAVKLFDWAVPGTPVVIVESLDQVPAVIAQNGSNCTLFASACSGKRAGS